jgi:hypothetical protein
MATQLQETGAGEKSKAHHNGKTDTHFSKVRIKDGNAQYAGFDHLTEQEQLILKRQIEVPDVKIGFTAFFRYATRKDLAIFFISGLCAIAGGAILPLMSVSSFDICTKADRRRLSLVPLPKAFRASPCYLPSRELPLIAISSLRHCISSTLRSVNTFLFL